jgi:pyruvate formate lyase activating enzyme
MVESNSANIKAPVFNIQTYSIHDGPGIRDTVFLKGCPLRCQWCSNPESQKSYPELMTYGSKCVGCGTCIKACPRKAIRLDMDLEKPIAVTDRNLCTNCGECVKACGYKAREIAGKFMTVEEVIAKVLRDKIFYEASGGGVTVSGGECLVYPEYTEALLYAAKQEGLHTALESSCYAGRDVIDRVFRHADLGFAGIKHMNSDLHKKYTGVPNEIILDNIKHIYHDLRIPVYIRLPIIPGCNDSEENITNTAKFAAEQLGTDVQVHLLPYHRFGESKNESRGENRSVHSKPRQMRISKVKAIFEGFT